MQLQKLTRQLEQKEQIIAELTPLAKEARRVAGKTNASSDLNLTSSLTSRWK